MADLTPRYNRHLNPKMLNGVRKNLSNLVLQFITHFWDATLDPDSLFSDLSVDLVLFKGVVLPINFYGQGQRDTQGGNGNHDGGQHQHMGQGVDVVGGMDRMCARIVAVFDNGEGCPPFGTNGDIKKDDGGLNDVHTDDLFHQVFFGDDGIKANHHQNDVYPEVVFRDYDGKQIIHV